MKKFVKFNLNNKISFIPTQESYHIYNAYMHKLKVYGRGLFHYMKDGRVEMSMHDFMTIFGPHFGPSHMDMPIKDMNVLVEVEDEK